MHTKVYLGHPTDREGFGLKVDINVEGVEDDAIIAAAHDVSLLPRQSLRFPETEGLMTLRFGFRQICPYSLALREGIEVNVTKA